MYRLARPDLTEQTFDAMDNASLRGLARELRVHSRLDGAEEFALYDDDTIADQVWRDAISSPPTTTTQVNLCVVKPSTKGTGQCYAEAIVRPEHPEWVGIPTDFLSHAWRYEFRDLVRCLVDHAAEYDEKRARSGEKCS